MSAPGHDGPLNHDLEYFLDMYDTVDDPWGFDSRWYERRKYALTLASLPERRYRRGLEPGCANGALTELLALRCDELIAFDLVPDAVDRARARLAHLGNVTVEREAFPAWTPPGTGDLIVWSEVAYYLTDAGFDVAAEGVERWLEPGGSLIAVHYTGTTNYPRTADATHEAIGHIPYLDPLCSSRDREFRIDVWTRQG